MGTTSAQSEFPDGGKLVAYPVYLVDGSGNPGVNGSTQSGVVAAGVGTSASVLKATPGYISGALITAVGTVTLYFYDNTTAASGTIIGAVPASATLGQYYPMNMPAKNGITAGILAGTPAVTVAFS